MPHEKGSSQPPCNPNYHAGYLQQEEGYHAFLPTLIAYRVCNAATLSPRRHIEEKWSK